MFLIPSHASRDRAHVTKADNEARGTFNVVWLDNDTDKR